MLKGVLFIVLAVYSIINQDTGLFIVTIILYSLTRNR